MMSLDIEEVNSVNEYNDFLEVTNCPQTPKLADSTQIPQSSEALPSEQQYEVCENCGRKFFEGRLIYHLKICTKGKPMLKSPAKSEKNTALQQQACLALSHVGRQTNMKLRQPRTWLCPQCGLNVPMSISDYHRLHCLPDQPNQYHSAHVSPRASPNKKSILPRIIKKHDPIKIREELSCFSKAANIQQVQCPLCKRKFEKNAALRHIPVCQRVSDSKDIKTKIKAATSQQQRPVRLELECQNCKRALQANHRFCGFCGAKRCLMTPSNASTSNLQ